MEKPVRKTLEAMCRPLLLAPLGDGCNIRYIYIFINSITPCVRFISAYNIQKRLSVSPPGFFSPNDPPRLMAEPEAFSTDRYDNLPTADISMPKHPFLLAAFLYILNEITKLDNVWYNNSLLVSFLLLWVPSVKPCPPQMTDPEVCLKRETGTKPVPTPCISMFRHYDINRDLHLPSYSGHRQILPQPSFPPEHGWPGGLPFHVQIFCLT
jgi:hypothetical protein